MPDYLILSRPQAEAVKSALSAGDELGATQHRLFFQSIAVEKWSNGKIEIRRGAERERYACTRALLEAYGL